MNARIIPADKAYLYRQVDVEHWWGVDAIELKDGTFFIKESDFNRLPADLRIEKQDPVSKQFNSISVKSELSKLPIHELSESDMLEPIQEVKSIKK